MPGMRYPMTVLDLVVPVFFLVLPSFAVAGTCIHTAPRNACGFCKIEADCGGTNSSNYCWARKSKKCGPAVHDEAASTEATASLRITEVKLCSSLGPNGCIAREKRFNLITTPYVYYSFVVETANPAERVLSNVEVSVGFVDEFNPAEMTGGVMAASREKCISSPRSERFKSVVETTGSRLLTGRVKINHPYCRLPTMINIDIALTSQHDGSVDVREQMARFYSKWADGACHIKIERHHGKIIRGRFWREGGHSSQNFSYGPNLPDETSFQVANCGRIVFHWERFPYLDEPKTETFHFESGKAYTVSPGRAFDAMKNSSDSFIIAPF